VSHADGLERALGRTPARVARIAGGDTAAAFRVELPDGSLCFAKRGPREALAREAAGLRWLAAGLGGGADGLGVPAPRGEAAGWLVLPWIERGRPDDRGEEALGQGLAALHRAGASAWGLERDNFVGALPQANAPRPTWARFYAEQRLAPLVRRAREAGLLPGARAARFEEACERMEELVGRDEPPARLHGDLWAGNALFDADGRPWLVDPAVYGGHREVDLAMMRLFGGFSRRTFAAYEEAWPLSEGWEARVPLYQVYPLLVHACLFGGGYAASAARALEEALASAR